MTPKAPAPARRGLPVWPTLLVLVAVPLLISFGVWQLQRAQWKEGLLRELAANSRAPLVVLQGGVVPDALNFRQVQMPVDCAAQAPAVRAGRNARGQNGYAVTLACHAGGAPLTLVAGWGPRADSWKAAPALSPLSARVAGTMILPGGSRDASAGAPRMLYSSSAPAPLQPAAAPGLDTISNNHRSYAVQWFSFAAILLAIYAIYARRWRLAQSTPSA